MSNVGHLRALKAPDHFQGDISTLLFSVTFTARPARSSKNPDAPTHTLYAYGNAGDEVEIGAMWRKKASRGENIGEEFFTLSFADPSMDKPVNVAAFKTPGKDGLFDITFRLRSAPTVRRSAA